MIRLLLALILLLYTPVAAVAFTTVVLDAGHGGHDRGGVPGQRVSEKALALDLTLRVNTILKAQGLKTVLTRSNDTFIPLPVRVAIGNRQPNAVFVSIHFNSAPREGAHGIETYYYSRSARRLAERIHPRLVRTNRTEDRRVRQRGFYVLRKSRIPAVLLECGFLTNRSEAALCSQPAHRQRMAEAIAAGILSCR